MKSFFILFLFFPIYSFAQNNNSNEELDDSLLTSIVKLIVLKSTIADFSDTIRLSSDKTKNELSEAINQYWDAAKDDRFFMATEALEKIRSISGLSSLGYNGLFSQYCIQEDYKSALDICKEWEEKFDTHPNWDDKRKLYYCYSVAYHHINDFRSSIKYLEKTIDLGNDSTKLDDAFYYFEIADRYHSLSNKNMTELFINKSVDMFLKAYGVTLKNIKKGVIKDDNLGMVLFHRCIYKNEHFIVGDPKEDLILSANCGYQEAINACINNNIKY